MRRLQLQLLFGLVAALSVTALSVLLISNAIRSAEGVVIADTRKTLATANAELDQQYSYRVSSDSSWSRLPAAAQDVSLRAISQATLRSYPGVEGGFFAEGQILGYAYPTHGSGTIKMDVPAAELPQIEAAIRQARTTGRGSQVLRGSRDLVVIQAVAHGDHVSWTMKRVSGITDPGEKRRNILLIGLVTAAFISITATLAAAIGLRRGLAEVQTGLARLETDFGFELPAKGGELGRISQSVNRVAATRRKLEAELRREDRLRAIGRLTANIAHEIRNPLNGIRLAMQMLKQKLIHREICQGDLDLVIEEVDRLNILLTDLLAFRETQRPSLEPRTVLPIVRQCVRLVEPQAHARDIDIQIRASDPQACARVDAKQLTQVLTNLLLNSITAVSQDGKIEVHVFTASESVLIEVCDTGPGVPAEHQEHLFEAFYTTRGDGTGLGLAVSHELVHGMGGTITYRAGSPGAVFALNFPLKDIQNETSSRC
jgi:signal transduction histidine kinase